MGHAPQNFAMFKPNNTCVLTIQLHFDFLDWFSYVKNRTNLPQLIRLRTTTNKKKTNKKSTETKILEQ